MASAPDEQLLTPPRRRLVRTNVRGVYRRGDRYVAVTYGRGKRIKTTHATKAEAKLEKSRRDAGGAPTSREPFERYVERWLVEYAGRTHHGLSPRTRQAYATLLRSYAVPYFRCQKIGDIGPHDVKHFIAHLTQLAPRHSQDGARRLSPATVRRIMCPLKALLAEAYELELTRVNAARVRIVIPGEPPATKPKTITYAQVDQILARLGEQDRLLFLFLSRTGLRISEALGAQWRDVEVGATGAVLVVRRQCLNGELVERMKTPASHRSVALMPALLTELLEHRQVRQAASRDPMFPSRAGSHQDSHNVRSRLRQAGEKCGLGWVTPHVFRHSFATEMRARGYDPGEISKVLGHRSEAFTRLIYIHVNEIPRFDDFEVRRLATTGVGSETISPSKTRRGRSSWTLWSAQRGRSPRRGQSSTAPTEPRADPNPH
jgi:integrase